MLFPEVLSNLQSLFNFQLIFAEADTFFTETMTKVIKERENRPRTVSLLTLLFFHINLDEFYKLQAKPDFLQLLLNALANEQPDKSDIDQEIAHEEIGGKRIKLTLRETIAQCFLFLLGGYETSAVTLHFALYLLALHPEIQDKCLEEINQVLGDTV